jgi:hypothetical protein
VLLTVPDLSRDGKHVGGSGGAKHEDGEEGGFGGSGRVVYLVWQDGRWVGGKNLYDLDAI